MTHFFKLHFNRMRTTGKAFRDRTRKRTFLQLKEDILILNTRGVAL